MERGLSMVEALDGMSIEGFLALIGIIGIFVAIAYGLGYVAGKERGAEEERWGKS